MAQSTNTSSSSFPQLEILDPADPHIFLDPSKCIHDGPDVARFLISKAYRDIGIFVMQLNRALCPRRDPWGSGTPKTFPLVGSDRKDPESIRSLQGLLEKTASIIDEAPPDPGPRRFGNISFRKWYKLLEDRVDGLLKEYVGADVLGFAATSAKDGQGETFGALDELRAYFLGGFGSPQRLDYGTGHELSFLAFLGSLWKLGAFRDGTQGGDVERSIVLGVFEPYLKVVRKLILTYTLEPAGSHGVWGLDDHSFMPYIFGSAQLTRPITEEEAMPLEGSVQRAPKPVDVTKSDAVEMLREVNMYFSAIGFINDVKKGPFWEHSPILYDISGIKDGWGKINKGMIKMFNAEVLSKFPVVQHFPFGSLFSWDIDPDASAPQQSIHMVNQPVAAAAGPTSSLPPGTGAPWAQATQMPSLGGPGIPGTAGAQISVTKAPWAK
ncbi:rotamase PTPA-1 [Cryphonectria parasitica EP155]|uniref:Serine/threonine-protein phosphatase 2A activator n=1 Tax=Cryphonectria parasitica (strain ATCC 38755 / EP155) TaxID=660469 RepID=A0A9P5CL58_CRYP1|nr:rotamase PTPA-1 [Cryphonectria parasitica EP155]KAF3761480.1 rotamase PTPA-1 [Cryphonectria parasitica EP155]